MVKCSIFYMMAQLRNDDYEIENHKKGQTGLLIPVLLSFLQNFATSIFHVIHYSIR